MDSKTRTGRRATMKTGDAFQQKDGECRVTAYHGSTDVDVVFPATGAVVNATAQQLRKGCLRDPLHPTVGGVGYNSLHLTSNPIQYGGGSDNPMYLRWVNMMTRCYKPAAINYHKYGAKGVRVDSRWHDYQNFAHDMAQKLDALEAVGIDVSEWQMDKDILGNGLLYSDETATMLPREVNNLFGGKASTRTDGLPQWVTYISSPKYKNSPYKTKVNLGKDVPVFQQRYPTVREAFMAAAAVKRKHCYDVVTAYVPATHPDYDEILNNVMLEINSQIKSGFQKLRTPIIQSVVPGLTIVRTPAEAVA